MSVTDVPKPNFALPLVEKDGTPTRSFRAWISALHERTGGAVDKVDAAHALASAAVPQGTEVNAAGGLSGGGALGGNVGLALYKRIDALAMLPATGNTVGQMAFALDARKPGEGASAGTGVPVFWQPGSPGSWFSFCDGAAAVT